MKAFIVLATIVACAVANPQVAYTTNVAGYPWAHHVAPAVTYAAAPAVTYATAPAVTYAAAPAVTYATAPVTYTSAVVAPVATKTQYHAQDELGQASYGYAHPGQAHAALRDAAGNVRGSYAYVDPNGKQVRVDYVADHNGYRAESNALPQGPVAGPAPVQDTPEVAAAKAAHLRTVDEVKHRQRRGVITYAATPYTYAHHPWGHAVAYTAPVTTYAAAPLAHTYTSAVLTHPVRQATLTKVVNTPGHAVSYRVD
jgi:hypothetical protein